jgi:protein-S-isoprenylcysteine O-methyltransferase Ste14
MIKLIVQALGTFLLGVFLLGLLLFLPAWTFNYWQAWVFIVVFMICVNGIGLYLALKDPALLERRKKVGPTKEQRPMQKIAISVGFLALLGIFVFSAISHRFGWSPVPAYVSLAGDILVVLGFFINLLVFKENTYGGATVETTADQKVISTGPYLFVRHPMYAGVLIMIIGIPLALDAWWGLAIIAMATPVLIWRILDEEKLLKKDLPGYVEYTQKVKFRLVPYLW